MNLTFPYNVENTILTGTLTDMTDKTLNIKEQAAKLSDLQEIPDVNDPIRTGSMKVLICGLFGTGTPSRFISSLPIPSTLLC